MYVKPHRQSLIVLRKVKRILLMYILIFLYCKSCLCLLCAAIQKFQESRFMIRLMEVLLHTGTSVSGWNSAFIHKTIVNTYSLLKYTINQLRYDLRKMKARGLIKRNGNYYTYQLSDKGMKTSAIFALFHKRICGPLANSLFNGCLANDPIVNSKLEKAYHQADPSDKNHSNKLLFGKSYVSI